MKKLIAISCLALITAVSCSSFKTGYGSMNENVGEEGYAGRYNFRMKVLASDLAQNLKGSNPRQTRIVATTFVPVGEYETSSPFGQLCAEQVLMGLSNLGFKAFEIRKSKDILIKNKEGFFSLSNRADSVNRNIRTDLVLVGSYALVNGELMINSMLVRADNSEVVSSATQMMQIQEDPFLSPMVKPIQTSEKFAALQAGQKGTIEIREPVFDKTDPTSTVLPLKIVKLASDIAKNLKVNAKGRPIVVTTYVDMDNMMVTNSFGRYMTERLMEELSMRGFRVVEVRASKELFVNPRVGETALTRNMAELLNKYSADAMVLGTYKKIDDTVHIHTRMVIGNNQEVVSVANTVIKAKEGDKFMESLFGNELSRVTRKDSRGGIRR